MNDTISRLAVIQIIEKMRARIGHNLERSVGRAMIEILDEVGKDVEKLPSAQPEIIRCRNCKLVIVRLANLIFVHGRKGEPMDDLISRAEAIDALTEYGNGRAVFISVGEAVIRIEQLPSAQPKRGKCKWCEKLKERNLRIEYYWIDKEGCTASFSEPHVVATGIANFCPNCGAKMVVTE